MKKEIEALKAELESKTRESTHLESTIEAEAAHYSSKIVSLEDQLAKLSASLDEERAATADVRDGYGKLGRMNDSLQNRIAETEPTIARLERDNKSLDVLVTNYSRQARETRDSVARLSRKLKSVSSTIPDLREACALEVSRAKEDAISTVTAVKDKYDESMKDMMHRHEALMLGINTENGQLKTDITRLQTEMTGTGERLRGAMSELTAERSTTRHLRAQIEQADDVLADVRREHEMELARLNDGVREGEGQTAKVEAELKTALNKISRLETSVGLAQRDLTGYKATNTELTAMLDAAREKAKKALTDAQRGASRAVELEERVATLERDAATVAESNSGSVNELQKTLLEKTKKLEELAVTHQTQMAELQAHWRARVEELTGTHDATQRSADGQIEGLLEDVQRLKGELKKAQADGMDAGRALKAMQEQRSAGVGEVSGLRKKVDQLEETIMDLKGEVRAKGREATEEGRKARELADEARRLGARVKELEARPDPTPQPTHPDPASTQKIMELEEEIEFLQMTVRNECAERAALLGVVNDLRSRLALTGAPESYPTSRADVAVEDGVVDLYRKRTKPRRKGK